MQDGTHKAGGGGHGQVEERGSVEVESNEEINNQKEQLRAEKHKSFCCLSEVVDVAWVGPYVPLAVRVTRNKGNKGGS